MGGVSPFLHHSSTCLVVALVAFYDLLVGALVALYDLLVGALVALYDLLVGALVAFLWYASRGISRFLMAC